MNRIDMDEFYLIHNSVVFSMGGPNSIARKTVLFLTYFNHILYQTVIFLQHGRERLKVKKQMKMLLCIKKHQYHF